MSFVGRSTGNLLAISDATLSRTLSGEASGFVAVVLVVAIVWSVALQTNDPIHRAAASKVSIGNGADAAPMEWIVRHIQWSNVEMMSSQSL